MSAIRLAAARATEGGPCDR